MKLVVGLGNPGTKYRYNRHNAGFLVLDNYLPNSRWKEDSNGLICESKGAIFCKPQSFMNSSGECVARLKNKHDIDNGQILVIYDDLHLPEGSFRFGINKNHGGHNGIRSIIHELGTKAFLTLRIGIGPREKAESIADYVMEDFSRESLELLRSLLPRIFESIEDFLGDKDILFLQNKYNS